VTVARRPHDFLERDNAPFTTESQRLERPSRSAVSTTSAPRRVEGEWFRVVRSDGMPVVFLQGETLPDWAPPEIVGGSDEPKPKNPRKRRTATAPQAKSPSRKPVAKRPAQVDSD
jgi:hypothetical protein